MCANQIVLLIQICIKSGRIPKPSASVQGSPSCWCNTGKSHEATKLVLSSEGSWSLRLPPTICFTCPWCRSIHGRNTLLGISCAKMVGSTMMDSPQLERAEICCLSFSFFCFFFGLEQRKTPESSKCIVVPSQGLRFNSLSHTFTSPLAIFDKAPPLTQTPQLDTGKLLSNS